MVRITEIAPGVHCLGFNISNVYLVGEKNGPWVVVDTCAPGHFEAIKEAAAELYGEETRPEAVILTHGHPDHYGSALSLASYWDIPIYAGRMDLPYLSGRSKMPPNDPTVGRIFGFVARFMPQSGTDLGDHLMVLPEEGSLPGMPGWKWYPTPGHTPGHVSLFRESDKTLIAGDAVLTVDTAFFRDLVTKKQTLAKPTAPMTYDWVSVRRSIRVLASLKPTLVASGHGIPMAGPEIAGKLQSLADDFTAPLHGRYIPEPSVFDENGIVYLPPAPSDPLPKIALAAGIATAVIVAASIAARQQRKKEA